MSAADVDALFQLPPAEFTAARNALAVRLKKEGRDEEAATVKGLSKPSVSAWVVNQLFWRHRKVFDRLLDAGDKLRRAQGAHLAGKGGDMREPLDARREALAELARLAAKALTEGSHNASPEMMRRITTTLEALSVYGTGAGAPPAGRLTDDVDPPGFDALATLVPAAGAPARGKSGPSTVLPFKQKSARTAPAKTATSEKDQRRIEAEQKARRAQALASVKDAERELRESRAAAAQAEAALKAAAGRVKAAEAARADAERRLEQADADLTAARTAARQVAAQAEEAAQVVADAERALAHARSEL